MLEINNCSLLIIDVQGKLAHLVNEPEILFKNIRILLDAAKILRIPILWCQQNPRALGPTVPEIAELLTDCQPFDKFSFSCCGCESFNAALRKSGRKQVLLCGIETHVCVYQTAADLLAAGFCVDVMADAVSSRTEPNKRIGIERMRTAGANISSVEMALFELLKTAEHPDFKNIAKLIK